MLLYILLVAASVVLLFVALINLYLTNAGIEKVVIRDDKDNYRTIDVSSWILDDESLEGKEGY